MMLRPKLHDHYIARAVILTVLGAWGVLLGLDVMLAFASEFEDLGKGGYTINHAIAAREGSPSSCRVGLNAGSSLGRSSSAAGICISLRA